MQASVLNWVFILCSDVQERGRLSFVAETMNDQYEQSLVVVSKFTTGYGEAMTLYCWIILRYRNVKVFRNFSYFSGQVE